MESSLPDKPYSETLHPSDVQLGPTSTAYSEQQCYSDGDDGDDPWHEDGSLCDDSIDELGKTSDLDMEWQRRRNQFHTIGYREGLMAGKEAAAQEGFNVGFRESVFTGYNLGLVRGVTSALACLPDGLKERLVETEEKRSKFQHLYESVHPLSSTDALKVFHNSLTNKFLKQSENADCSSHLAEPHDQSTDGSLLGNYYRELQSLSLESPAVEVHLKIDQ